MGLIGKIQALYLDRKQTQPIFPITKTKAVSNDEGTGLDAILEEKASKDYVQEKILEVQAGGVDLSAYAKKEYVDDEIGKIDFPVDSINDKTGEVDLSASDVGALPITGGQVTGALDVNGGVIMWKDAEGGNVRLNSPDGKTTDFWEMDASNGERFRIFTYKNATHENGEGYVMPLDIYSDGSIGVGNTSKTRENLGITPTNIGAMAATSKSLSNMSVKDWAASLTSSAWGYTDTSTTDMPAEISSSNNYAIATANVAASGGWIELRLTYVLTGCVAVAVYNYGWSEWEWVNPPMELGKEYRTSERYNGKPVYIMAFNAGSMPNNKTLRVTLPGKIQGQEIIHTALRIKSGSNSMQMAYGADPGYFIEGTNLALTTTGDFSSYTATATFKYTKD